MNRLKRIHLNLIVAVAVALLSGCFFSSSSTSVTGRVTEYGKKPVAGAEIKFGGTGAEATTKTDADGRFSITASHRPTQMLRLQVIKDGFVMKEKVEFPGFAAPDKPIEIELMEVIGRSK